MSGIAEYPAHRLDNFFELCQKYARNILKQKFDLQFMISMISREIEFITMKRENTKTCREQECLKNNTYKECERQDAD